MARPTRFRTFQVRPKDLAAGPREAERAGNQLVDGGYASQYDYALETLKEVPYNKWRVYDPEDTIRFWALRLREAGIISRAPPRSLPKPPTGGSSTNPSAD